MAEVHAISEILLVSSNPTNKDEKIAMLSGNTVCNNCNLSNIIINFRKVSGTISFGLFITEEQKNYRIKIRGYVRDKRNNNLFAFGAYGDLFINVDHDGYYTVPFDYDSEIFLKSIKEVTLSIIVTKTV